MDSGDPVDRRIAVNDSLLRLLLDPIPPLHFCSWGCRCRELSVSEYLGVANLPLLGYEVEPIQLIQKGFDYVPSKSDVPLVWFGPKAAGVIVEEDGKIQGRTIPARGRPRPTHHSSEFPCAAAYRIRRARGIGRWRSRRRAEALLNAAAVGLVEAGIGLCPGAKEATVCGSGRGGLSAFRQAPIDPTLRLVRSTIKEWEARLRSCADTLAALGRHESGSPGCSLRDGASSLRLLEERVYDVLPTLLTARRIGRPAGQVWTDLRARTFDAVLSSERASAEVLNAALIRSGSEPRMADMLAYGGDALPESAVSELTYLARSGSARFRLLAARRLAETSSAPAIGALAQLLYERDAPISDTALESLARIHVPAVREILERAYESVPESRIGSRTSLRPMILDALGQRFGNAANDLLVSAMSEEERPDSAAIRAAAAAQLYRNLGRSSEPHFRRAAESGGRGLRALARHYLQKIARS